MLQTVFSLILLLGFVFFGVLLLRRFVFSTQWFLSDMYFAALLSAIPLGFIFTGLHPFAVGLREAEQMALLCAGCELPVLIGSWWGLNSARRLGELRVLHRYVLIVSCVVSTIGALGLIAAFLATVMAFMFSGRVNEPFSVLILRAALVWVAAIVLLIPGLVVESRCRKSESQRRRK